MVESLHMELKQLLLHGGESGFGRNFRHSGHFNAVIGILITTIVDGGTDIFPLITIVEFVLTVDLPRRFGIE